MTPTATISPTLTPTPLPTVTLFPTSTLELGPEGGAFASDDGQIAVEFPAGAVKLKTKLRLEKGALPKAGGASRVASPFRLTAATAAGGFPVFSFAKPLTITVRYSAADEVRLTQKLGAGSRLDLFYYDPAGGTWVILPGTTDRAARTITAFTDHFTDYGILATYCPKPPNVLNNGCFQTDLSGWQLTSGSGGIAITHNISDGLPAGSVKLPGYVNENLKQTIGSSAITTTGFFTFGFNVSTTNTSEQVRLKLQNDSDVYAQVDAVGETGWVTKTVSVALTTSSRSYDIIAQTLSNLQNVMHLDNVVLAYDRPIPHFDSGSFANGGFEGSADGWTRTAASGKSAPSYLVLTAFRPVA